MQAYFRALIIGWSALLLVNCAKSSLRLPPRQNSQDLSVVDENVIYGEDSRKDFYQITDNKIRQLFKSTVALIPSENVHLLDKDVARLITAKYQDENGLCKSEKYLDQRTAPVCTGSLIGPDLVLTAGHCVSDRHGSVMPDFCNSTEFVFDYFMTSSHAQPYFVRTRNIYRCKEVIHSSVDRLGADFAIVRLDRPVLDRSPIRLRKTGSVNVGDELFLIGYPAKLPAKYIDGANVRRVDTDYLVANLDTFEGNSGSPVFNKTTGEQEGILVRGENDFNGVQDSSGQYCNVSNVCPNGGCRGEDATLISAVLPFIPPGETP